MRQVGDRQTETGYPVSVGIRAAEFGQLRSSHVTPSFSQTGDHPSARVSLDQL